MLAIMGEHVLTLQFCSEVLDKFRPMFRLFHAGGMKGTTPRLRLACSSLDDTGKLEVR